MITDRILQLIEYENITKNKFYIKTGLSNGFLDKVKDIGVSKVEKILKAFPSVNPIWLLTGEGSMLKTSIAKNADANSFLLKNSKPIPLVNELAVGGFGNSSFSISEEDIKEYYIIPKFRHKKIDFMIEVFGDSMLPRYRSGDIVACQTANYNVFIQWNKIHVIATRDQGIIMKRILQGSKKGYVTLVADNSDYPPFEIPLSEITGVALVQGLVSLEG